jgi:Domain of unknown function (DUF4260)
MIEGPMRWLLRAEGLALFAAAVVMHVLLGMGWIYFVLLFFVPDLAFIAYLAGPRIGAYVYNIMHSTIGPFIVGAFAYLQWPEMFGALLAQVAIVWFSHIGFDRMLGYGLKYTSGFKDTHLGKL